MLGVRASPPLPSFHIKLYLIFVRILSILLFVLY
nr:MAG TPA: hypothetical protein [Caudoviricetes sp.]